MSTLGLPGPHRVLFDVNVYLDLAELFGMPVIAIESAVSYALLKNRNEDHPCYPAGLRPVDSLRAVALAAGIGVSQEYVPTSAGLSWEICLSNHIVATTLYKLTDPTAQFKWPLQDAEEFRDGVVLALHKRTRKSVGRYAKVTVPVGVPPLEDDEDGLVMASALATGAGLLVTCDGPFVNQNDQLGASIEFPDNFIDRNWRLRKNLDSTSVGRQLGWLAD
jgi:hypothetical protein